MDIAIVAAVFPIIFLGELPDKTMFASLIMSTRGRAGSVWLGAAAAFVVHVAIAVTVGAALFALLPQPALNGVVALMFLAGGGIALREATKSHDEVPRPVTARRITTTAFVVIFLAEWGDLTQILTANLAAHYHSPLSVALGAVLALWAVAGLAVLGGQRLIRIVPVKTLRIAMAVVLFALGGLAGWQALS